MKVLFATNFNYLPQRYGGSESSTNDLCVALQKNGSQVAVMCSLGMYDSIWIRNRLAAKLTGNRFIQDNLLSYPVFRGYKVKEGIAEVVETFRPDIVVVQAGLPFELVNSFSKIKIPVIFYARDIEFQRNSEALNINSYVGFIANSLFTARQLKLKFDVNALVLPPIVDPQKYKVNSSRTNVLHIGLVKEKGIEVAFALASRRPDINFQFVESWPISKSEFKVLKNRANVLKNVKVFKSTADMRKFYETAKLLLVPSMWEEAWGRVVTESHLSGIPVITSNRGGLPESVGSGGLILHRDATIEQWENALSLMWDDADEYLRLSNAALIRSQNEDISAPILIKKFISYLDLHRQAAHASAL